MLCEKIIAPVIFLLSSKSASSAPVIYPPFRGGNTGALAQAPSQEQNCASSDSATVANEIPEIPDEKKIKFVLDFVDTYSLW